MPFTYHRQSRKLVRVRWDGDFCGWLEQTSHKPTGLNRKRYTVWSGRVCDVNFRATTLTEIKRRIGAALAASDGFETVSESRYGADDQPCW